MNMPWDMLRDSSDGSSAHRSWNRASPPRKEKLRRLTTFGELVEGDVFEFCGATLIKAISSEHNPFAKITAVCIFCNEDFITGVQYMVASDAEVYQIRLQRE